LLSRVALVVGTRPQIIKSAPVVYEALKRGLELEIIHTGQHYEYLMSDVFFEELTIPKPVANLGVGSGSHGYQVGEIIVRLEKILLERRYDLVLVPGDTNSALASAIAAVKAGVSVAHIEAGARSYDMRLQEEINRRLIDHVSTLLFAVSENCVRNLEKESVLGRIVFSGDTMYEIYMQASRKAESSRVLERVGVEPKSYAVLTLHRAENVDDLAKLLQIISELEALELKVVFPVHPRTRNRLVEAGYRFESDNIVFTEPLSYVDMVKLVKSSLLVITDSGGLQKEAYWSGVPCVTMRDRTEWVELVEMGVNFLAHPPSKIRETVRYVLEHYDDILSRIKHSRNPYLNIAGSKPSEIIVDEVISFTSTAR